MANDAASRAQVWHKSAESLRLSSQSVGVGNERRLVIQTEPFDSVEDGRGRQAAISERAKQVVLGASA